MTQDQLTQIEAWRNSRHFEEMQNDEHIVNAMWLSEEMWECHHAIIRIKNYDINLGTYTMHFCMTLMEYIWMPHDIVKGIVKDLDQLVCVPETFYCYHNAIRNHYVIGMSWINTNDEGHDYEVRDTLKIFDTKTEAAALTAILNHANKAGHDATTRLST